MKNSLKGACLSGLVYPGLGQIVQKHYVRGILIIGVFTASLFEVMFTALKQYQTILVNMESSNNEYDVTTMFQEASTFTAHYDTTMVKFASALMLGCWVIGIVDAYLSGKNTAHDHRTK